MPGTYEEILARLTPQGQKVVTQILDNLDNGKLAWRKGWSVENLKDSFGLPFNPVSGTTYSGVNSFYLAMQGYNDPRFLTFNQMQDKGYRFKENAKGKGLPVEFYSMYDKNAKKPFDREFEGYKNLSAEEQAKYVRENCKFVLKNYTVFNASLMDGIEPFKVTDEDKIKRNETVERIIAGSEAPVSYDGGNRAFYRPGTDSIHLPPRAAFNSPEELYGTALHEIGHSTGHPSRLNRDMSGSFGSAKYAVEELRAEFASALMSVQYGVQLAPEHIENHAAYIQSWKSGIRENPQTLIDAIKDASKITAYVAGREQAGYDKMTGFTEFMNAPVETDEQKAIRLAKIAQLEKEAKAEERGAHTQPSQQPSQPHAAQPPVEQAAANAAPKIDNTPPWILAVRKQRIAALEQNVPPEMKALPQWCAFNGFYDKATGHTEKRVWDCNLSDPTKHRASPTDPKTWTTFENALAYARDRGCDGMVFALTKSSGIFCIDLDKCKTETAPKQYKYSDLAFSVQSQAKGTYAERSVSGKGLHFFGLKSNNADLFAGLRKKNAAESFELYDDVRFMSMTGELFMNAKPTLQAFTDGDGLIAVARKELAQVVRAAAPQTAASSQTGAAKPGATSYKPNYSGNKDETYRPAGTDEVIGRIRNSKDAKVFSEMYDKGSDLCGNLSRTDLKLCGIAAKFSNGDVGITAEVLEKSALWNSRTEMDRRHKMAKYITNTAELACKNLNSGMAIKPIADPYAQKSKWGGNKGGK